MLKFFIMFFRRFFFIFTLISLLSLISPIPLSAQSENILKQKQDAIKKGTNQESWLSEAMSSNLVSTLQVLTGPIPDEVIAGQAVSFIPGGALGTTNNLIAALYSPPASGIEYLADLWHSKFLGKPAYAQGIGFRGLQPILPIWRGFRNVVYLLSSLIFVIIGIMIILRVKISPQAVVTVQNAIPQLITTLILVTFSYAIAGLIIDIANLLTGFALAILFQVEGRSFAENLLKEDMFHALLPGARYSFKNLVDAGFADYIELAFLAIPKLSILIIGAILGGTIGAIVGGAVTIGSLAIPSALIGAGIGTALFVIIITIVVLIWLLKFFFGALKCYVTIIFKIILAPLEIGIGAFPNSKSGFSGWLIDLIANISVFPISFLFLVLVNLIIQHSSGGIWAPKLINSSAPGLLLAVGAWPSGGIIPIAIGIGGLMILSKLPELVPQALFQLKPSPWSQTIGAVYKESISAQIDSAKSMAGMAVGRPLLQQASDILAKNETLNRIRVGRKKEGLGSVLSGPVEEYANQKFREKK